MRVSSAEVAKQLYDSGGLRFNGVRWFVDYVGRKPEGRVLWIPWKSPESWSDYAQRVRHESNGSIVNGLYELGFCILEADPRWKPPRGRWQLRGVPWNTDFETVVEMLESKNFSDVELLNKLVVEVVSLGDSLV